MLDYVQAMCQSFPCNRVQMRGNAIKLGVLIEKKPRCGSVGSTPTPSAISLHGCACPTSTRLITFFCAISMMNSPAPRLPPGGEGISPFNFIV